MQAKETHSLTLKVMRLSKPGFQIAPPVLCEKDDVPGDILCANQNPKLGVGSEAFGLTNFLQLPTSFGILYLGETFSMYISVNNATVFDVEQVSLVVELQTTTQRIRLYDNAKSPIAKFESNESNDHVVQHEVKEGGVNILSCTVSYTKHDGEEKKFTKFFKFQVMNPFAIIPKVHTLQNTIFLEALVENITQSPIFLEYIGVEPLEIFTCTDLNPTPPPPTLDAILSLSRDIVYMKPGSSRLYLFKLMPKDPDNPDAKVTNVIGRLEVVWRSTMGEVGRLQTVPLQRRLVQDDLDLTLGTLPSRIVLEQPFPVQCTITNKGQKSVSPLLCVVKGYGHDGIRINGHQVKEVGLLQPNSQAVLQLDMFPIKPGMQKIGGLALHIEDPAGDARIPRAYNFNSLADVFVHNN